MGLPYATGFGVRADLLTPDLDIPTFWQGVQVQPNPVHGYRNIFAIFEVTEPIDVAASRATANTDWGDGGTPQYYVPGVSPVDGTGGMDTSVPSGIKEVHRVNYN
jgi:hypothetical protein